MNSEPMAALATPPGIGGIAVIRVTGYQLKSFLAPIFRLSARFKNQAPHTIHYNQIIEDHLLIDEVLVSYFRAPDSYTGEDVVEINCHGGLLIAENILKILWKLGIRPAQNGEFTKRAFLNGKMDLTRAEAINALIHAQSDMEIKAGILQLKGQLLHRIQQIKSKVIELIQLLNLSIDFVEHIDWEIDVTELEIHVSKLIDDTQSLIRGKQAFDQLHRGFDVVIAGQPNVGKSSLMNLLTGHEASIVHPTPGTTRDLIEKTINLFRLNIRLTDSAGLRNEAGEIEALGIEKSRLRIKEADVVLYLLDASRPELFEDDHAYISERKGPIITILNKIDISCPDSAQFWPDAIPFSTRYSSKLEILEQKISSIIEDQSLHSADTFYIQTRQLLLLNDLNISLEELRAQFRTGFSVEIASHILREGLDILNRFTGETKDIDIINDIFNHFCIGK